MEELLKQLLMQRANATLTQASAEHQAVSQQLQARQAARDQVLANVTGRAAAPTIRVRPADVVHESDSSRPRYLARTFDKPTDLADALAGGTASPDMFRGYSPSQIAQVYGLYLPEAMNWQRLDANLARMQAENNAEDAARFKAAGPGRLPRLYADEIIKETDTPETRDLGNDPSRLRYDSTPGVGPLGLDPGWSSDGGYRVTAGDLTSAEDDLPWYARGLSRSI